MTASPSPSDSSPQAALREQIQRSLRPVKPLPSPLQRALIFVAVSVILFLAVALLWGRAFQPIPFELLALVWIVHTALATVLFAAGLAESVPGRLLSSGRLAALIALGAGVVVSSAVAFVVLAPYVPSWLTDRVTRVCLTRAYALGLLPLTLAAVLTIGGMTSRPVIAGTLAGLGAGLLVESNWRLYCSVTEPVHAVLGHLGATALLTATGGLAGFAFRLLRWKRSA